MQRTGLILLTGVCLCVWGCGEGQSQGQAPREAEVTGTPPGGTPLDEDSTYTANGTITAIAGNQVTIAHEAVSDLDWPAATADFQAQNLDQIIDLRPGDKVQFSFNQAGGQYILTRIQKR